MRTVCYFSAGAASAVATKLALASNPDAVIVTVEIAEEHPDNARFRMDCEKWFGKPITVLRDQKYGASVRQAWRQLGFIKSNRGASCTMRIKRAPLQKFEQAGDVFVLGFTSEEQERADDWQQRRPDATLSTPLIEAGLTKGDCLGMLQRAGIELPVMYRLGFSNNNCIGCCKGGMGYWNKIREYFPDDFEECASIQEAIGPNASFFKHGDQRISLRELPPDAGRFEEMMPDCSLFCEMAESQYAG